MVYLDNAATTLQKPPAVAAAVAHAIVTHGNAARGAHAPAMAAARAVLAARLAVADMFGVGSPERVILTSGATMALNIAIAGLSGRVISTEAEHNAVLRPLYRRGNFELVPVDDSGRLDMARFRAGIDAGAGGVVMTHASNVCGNVYCIEEVADLCRRRRIPLILDAAQTAGLLPIDMQALGVAALCFSAHKSLYGPAGIGCLCLAPGFTPPPLAVGGTGGDSFSPEAPAELPVRLEAGTANSAGAAGLLAGLEYVASVGPESFARADKLARAFTERVRGIAGVRLYGDYGSAPRLPIVALNIRGIDASAVADVLDERFGIAVRAGAHCAPLMHKALGTAATGAVRFSFAHTNSQEDVDRAVAALGSV